MCEDLILLTRGTSLDVVCNPFLHLRPPVSFLRFPKGFVAAWMPCCWVVMHEGHDTSFYFKDRWYDNLSLGSGSGRGYCEFIFGEYYDVFVVGFSLVGAWWS